MKIVIQEDEAGCGFAVVAMISGNSYSIIRELASGLGIYATDEKLYSSTTYVRALASELGIGLSKNKIDFTGWDSLPDVALLATKYTVEDCRQQWHWSVYDGVAKQVLDPASYLEKNNRTDFENINVEWYIEVTS